MNTQQYKSALLHKQWVAGKVSLCELKQLRDTFSKQLEEVQEEIAVIEDVLSSTPIHCDCYDCRNDPNNH